MGTAQSRRPEPADVARLARRLVYRAVDAARTEDKPLRRLLLDHLGGDVDGLPSVSGSWPSYEHVNLQAEPERVIERTEGVTASFLKELIRKAALLACEDGIASGAATGGQTAAETGQAVPIRVTDDHMTAALDQLLDTKSQLTRVLLGGGQVGGEAGATAGAENDPHGAISRSATRQAG